MKIFNDWFEVGAFALAMLFAIPMLTVAAHGQIESVQTQNLFYENVEQFVEEYDDCFEHKNHYKAYRGNKVIQRERMFSRGCFKYFGDDCERIVAGDSVCDG